MTDTERLREAPMTGLESKGPPEPGSFADGYHQGRDDILYGIAHGSEWALKLLATARSESDAALSTPPAADDAPSPAMRVKSRYPELAKYDHPSRAAEPTIPHPTCRTPSECRREQVCLDAWNCSAAPTRETEGQE